MHISLREYKISLREKYSNPSTAIFISIAFKNITTRSQITILYLSLNIDTTNWAMFACDKPLIHTIAMKQMHTRQASEEEKKMLNLMTN